MSEYFETIRTSILYFPLVAVLSFVPYAYFQYRKIGYVQFNRSLVFYVFGFYAMTAFFLTLLPLPEITPEFCARRAGKVIPSFFPFRFVRDTFREVSGNISLFSIVKSQTFMVTAFNVLLLMPLGFFLRYLFQVRHIAIATLIGFFVSLFFEITQLTAVYGLYPCRYRHFEVDDLITNTFGCFVGFLIAGYTTFLPNISRKPLLTRDSVTLTQRFLAIFVDSLIVILLTSYLIEGLTSNIWLLSAMKVGMIFFYFIWVGKITNGQTFGKKLLGIRIVRMDGGKLRFKDLIARYGIFLLLPFMVGEVSKFLIDTRFDDNFYLFLYLFFLAIWFVGTVMVTFIRKDRRGWLDRFAHTTQVLADQKKRSGN
ncbi:VanZ family protein [Algoriphagus halophytocola]|uniref:VanZ family protein n=1 Tax=Algoriphagus halophytocola TaxID=2991499 RepID=A0ABY6MKK2_9BACT|nr:MULTISPECIES: VanZ family protein [unclassified Algoriphagus]UZD22811.1 VanZ family protein [Algoriphagus sp. TR-M5]WBL44076.1 VanZ family protein [Algoriphagus sp. TR-M9]